MRSIIVMALRSGGGLRLLERVACRGYLKIKIYKHAQIDRHSSQIGQYSRMKGGRSTRCTKCTILPASLFDVCVAEE